MSQVNSLGQCAENASKVCNLFVIKVKKIIILATIREAISDSDTLSISKVVMGWSVFYYCRMVKYKECFVPKLSPTSWLI